MIVEGVKLLELSMSDMLDVIHYLFEEDSTRIGTGEHLEARDAVRSQLYSSLYDIEYKYVSSKSSSSSFDSLDPPLGEEEMLPDPLDIAARSRSVKPFKPATDFDPDSPMPFGTTLDAPLG